MEPQERWPQGVLVIRQTRAIICGSRALASMACSRAASKPVLLRPAGKTGGVDEEDRPHGAQVIKQIVKPRVIERLRVSGIKDWPRRRNSAAKALPKYPLEPSKTIMLVPLFPKSGLPNLAGFGLDAGHGVAGVHNATGPLGQLLVVHASCAWWR